MIRILSFLALMMAATQTEAARDADLCRAAAVAVASETGVQADVLLALTLLETGRAQSSGELSPWPWALNIAGAGHWPASQDEAVALAENAIASGQNSVDIGCFQINWRWHGHHFDSPRALMDPDNNARYAADFLTALYGETGDWTLAVGAYHSRTELYAARYRDRFTQIRDGLGPVSPMPFLARANSFPLLQARGRSGALGSLVPFHDAG